ncbi:MAG: hypothetical protein NTX16_10615 [Actinobacteria bacterium]|nr:hypothetical protein [Actinomycetota bacterium]
MNGAAQILGALLDHGLLLTLTAGRLSVISPLGRPLPDAMRTQIALYRAEIIAELTWQDTALALVTDCLARVERQYVPGCPLGDEELLGAEATITTAFRAHDRARLRRCLDDYRLACWTRCRRFAEPLLAGA